MPMNIRVMTTPMAGVLLIEPECFKDERGLFYESYSRKRFAENGLELDFVQDNHSCSVRGVVRGLHFQDAMAPQWRLVRCTVGRIWDVIVDLRADSPTFGRYAAFDLSANERRQLLMPPEFAHGFCVLSELAEVQYKCTRFHTPEAERTLAWNDPEVAIPWPVPNPILSAKDREHGRSLKSYREDPVFRSQQNRPTCTSHGRRGQRRIN
jgi:dTDP-4-dehydrorhamnose 3,5-epimerase